jgi:uncharacterized membrane protein
MTIPNLIAILLLSGVIAAETKKYLTGNTIDEADNEPIPQWKYDPNTGYSVLGFLFPLVGLILFFHWSDNNPKRAKACGFSALIGGVISIIVLLIINASLLTKVADLLQQLGW